MPRRLDRLPQILVNRLVVLRRIYNLRRVERDGRHVLQRGGAALGERGVRAVDGAAELGHAPEELARLLVRVTQGDDVSDTAMKK